MSGGATPHEDGREIVLSLTRMNRILEIDKIGYTMTVEAGVVLKTIQEAAAEHDRLFPLSLGAEGSCTIGGNLSTNAGGVQVLHYGNARQLVLGLEVVTAAAARSGTACARSRRTIPATTCATSISAPRARSASSPRRC